MLACAADFAACLFAFDAVAWALRAYPKEFGVAVAALAKKLMNKRLEKPADQSKDDIKLKTKQATDRGNVDAFFKAPVDDFWEDELSSDANPNNCKLCLHHCW